ncbi:MAG TPA: class I SAM-dependent methyltransferase [Bryobacteraceae bacterium]|jgi:SAM-dependent methyltransferase
MEHGEVRRYWDRNAAVWTHLAREGWDVYRDAVNTPAFFELLPDVAGLRGLDVGCGEGHNTRLLGERGARMFGVDISEVFLGYAAGTERGAIHFIAGSAQELPFASGQFDFVTSLMCLMDLPDQAAAFREIHRVLRAGGFLQFSIVHPCFAPPYRKVLRDAEGKPYAVAVGRYFERGDGEIDRWIFSAAPKDVRDGLRAFEVPTFHRTISEWLNMVVESGFTIERVAEPRASEETARRVPAVADTRGVAYFLQVRCRKEGS